VNSYTVQGPTVLKQMLRISAEMRRRGYRLKRDWNWVYHGSQVETERRVEIWVQEPSTLTVILLLRINSTEAPL